MSVFDNLLRKIKYGRLTPDDEQFHQYCPRCEADLTMQKGYDSSLRHWVCLGCGEMLINPEDNSRAVWSCDGCGAFLNEQPGFTEDCGTWQCTQCGFSNKISDSELFTSEEEYENYRNSPHAGLSDKDLLELLLYEDVGAVDDRDDVILVRRPEDGSMFVKKYLAVYDKSICQYLLEHPLSHLPKIISIHEGSNCLIVIEEFVEGQTVASFLDNGPLSLEDAIRVTKGICEALKELHGLAHPIIHRDIKPSNVIVRSDGEVYLVDVNVAKWYNPEKTDDTRYLGTPNYAAPEQAGFGLSSSSPKSDIHGVGVILNEMITGALPKEKRATGKVWEIIERCINLEPENRYNAWELYDALTELETEGAVCNGEQTDE